MLYYQQGDVLLKRITRMPGKLQKTNNMVLQEGETTGHKHRLVAGAGSTVTVMERPGDLLNNGNTIMPGIGKYIRIVGNTVQLLHEEHKPITIAPGIYEMDLVREYNYDADEMTRVRD